MFRVVLVNAFNNHCSNLGTFSSVASYGILIGRVGNRFSRFPSLFTDKRMLLPAGEPTSAETEASSCSSLAHVFIVTYGKFWCTKHKFLHPSIERNVS